MNFFTSDTHAYHKNICRGTTEWKHKEEQGYTQCRDFNTPEEMTEQMIFNINSLVKWNDVLYHLGDWSFGGADKIIKFRERINCNTIHLILGNHDQHIEKDSVYRNLFSSVSHYKEIQLNSHQYGKVRTCMFHYATRVWNKSHHGSIFLYGHSHGTLEDAGNRSMDVGVDTNNLFPYSEKEILDRLMPRTNDVVDHHNKGTN